MLSIKEGILSVKPKKTDSHLQNANTNQKKNNKENYAKTKTRKLRAAATTALVSVQVFLVPLKVFTALF